MSPLRVAHHEEGLGGAVDSQEEDVDAVQAEHADGDGRGEGCAAVEEEECGGEGVAEGDDEGAELREGEKRGVRSTGSEGGGRTRWRPAGPGSDRAWRPAGEREEAEELGRRRDRRPPRAAGRGSEPKREPEVVDDLVDALVVHGDGAEGQEVLLALRQQLLEEGLLEEEEDEAHRAGGHGLEHGAESVERVGVESVGVGSVHELTKLPEVSGNERKGGREQDGVEKRIDELGETEGDEAERGEEGQEQAVEDAADEERLAFDEDFDVGVERELREDVEGLGGEADEGCNCVDEYSLCFTE